MADYPAHYKYMASQGGGASVNQPYLAAPGLPPTGMTRFQELPRLQVPSFALQQQAPQPWKASPVLAPQPQPSRMSVSNILSFRRSSSSSSSAPVLSAVAAPPSPPPAPTPAPPSRRLPSFQEILARTNLLNIMSRSSDEPAPAADAVDEEDEEQMVVDVEPALAPTMSSGDYYQQQQHYHAQYAPQQYAPVNDMNVSMGTPSSVGLDAAQAVPSSPVSQASESNKRRERWTEEEHALFMEGLNRYGRKWKKIQTYVKTKTAVQVRTHAYGYFAKLLRNMPEDDAIWELAEEMSSLPGAVLKGPGNGKRRNEPKTDEQGMEVLRRFVFSKKKSDEAKKALASNADNADNAMDDGDNVDMVDDSAAGVSAPSEERPMGQPTLPEAPAPRRRGWPFWGDSSASSTAEMELKRQRLS